MVSQPPGECSQLPFAEVRVPRRPYTAPALADDRANKNTPGVTRRGHLENMERETGSRGPAQLAKRLRLRRREPATLSLGNRPDRKK